MSCCTDNDFHQPVNEKEPSICCLRAWPRLDSLLDGEDIVTDILLMPGSRTSGSGNDAVIKYGLLLPDIDLLTGCSISGRLRSGNESVNK